jgi:hypothetical protein
VVFVLKVFDPKPPQFLECFPRRKW